MQADGMVNLDPSWKKEKLFEEIEEIEKKLRHLLGSQSRKENF
jgi:hypothetical protein